MPEDYMTLQSIVDQLRYCDYECEGGPLHMNQAFLVLEDMARGAAALDEQTKECPLFVAAGRREDKCARAKCEWWNRERGGCSVPLLADAMDYIADKQARE
jgi:hypothetical protein